VRSQPERLIQANAAELFACALQIMFRYMVHCRLNAPCNPALVHLGPAKQSQPTNQGRISVRPRCAFAYSGQLPGLGRPPAVSAQAPRPSAITQTKHKPKPSSR